MNYQDLGEHASVLVSLLAAFAGISAFLLWRMMTRMEKKLDEVYQYFCACREELAERFVYRYEHETDRQDLWSAINNHDHDLRGRVVR